MVKIEASCCRVSLKSCRLLAHFRGQVDSKCSVLVLLLLVLATSSLFWTKTRHIFTVPVCTQQQSHRHRAHYVLHFFKQQCLSFWLNLDPFNPILPQLWLDQRLEDTFSIHHDFAPGASSCPDFL